MNILQTAPALDRLFTPAPRQKFASSSSSSLPVSILGVPIDPVTMDEALSRIDGMIQSGKPHYVVTPNVDFLVQAQGDAELHRILCEADLVLCDGQPLVWASRWMGNPLPERVAGADLAPRIVAQAAERGHRIFLLGASPEANAAAAERLQEQYPTLQLAGAYSPPFRPLTDAENEELVCRIRAAEADILFVAFGCPKQEKWIVQNYQQLGVPVCLGLGATIDFLAGRVSRAPVWMRRVGLEWSYRLVQEPRRLFRRYWTDARYFGTALLRQWWFFGFRAPAAPRGRVEIRNSSKWQTVRARGDLVRSTIEREARKWRHLGESGRDCRLDLSQVNFIDSTGAAALSHWHRKLRRNGRRLVLFGSNGRVRRLLQQAGLTHFETAEIRDQIRAA